MNQNSECNPCGVERAPKIPQAINSCRQKIDSLTEILYSLAATLELPPAPCTDNGQDESPAGTINIRTAAITSLGYRVSELVSLAERIRDEVKEI